METSLPTPMTARVELLIYQRVDVSAGKIKHCGHVCLVASLTSQNAFSQVPMESPRLVLQVEAEPPDPPKARPCGEIPHLVSSGNFS